MVQPVIDTLQTLPSFVYLIPVVMLFRVGEFTAMIAIVLYAARPGHPLHRARHPRDRPRRWSRPPAPWAPRPSQRLLKLRLPLALPEILLGINQTILLAVSMLVITALVGTRDLGQEVYIALTRADVGAGPGRRRLHRHARDDRRPDDDRRRRPHPRPPRPRPMTRIRANRCMRCACVVHAIVHRPESAIPRPRHAFRMTPLERAATLPIWTGPVTPEPLAGGITNLNFTVTDAGRRYLVRIGGDIPEHMILRRFERAAARAAHAAGLAPAVRHAEEGALVLDFIEGRTLTAADVRDPANLDRLAALVRRCHTEIPRHYRGPAPIFWVFQVLRDYAHTLARGRHPLRPRPAPRRRRDPRSGHRPGRDRLRPQRPAARQPHRRRRPPLARRLGIRRLQHARSSTSAASPPTPA